MASNVTADKIEAFAAAREVLHSRAVTIARHGGDVDAGLAEFNARPWSARRTSFEAVWADGQSAIYGAISVGGLGVEDYGPFCLVFEDPSVDSMVIAVFPTDSAQTYDCSLPSDREKARSEATSWTERASLGVTKHSPDIPNQPETRWPSMVCNSGDYMEVVRIGALPLSILSSIRVPAADWKAYRDRKFNRPGSLALEPRTEQALAVIDRWSRTLGTKIQPI